MTTHYPNPLTLPVWPDRLRRGAFFYWRDGSHAWEAWMGAWKPIARIDGERVTWIHHERSGMGPRGRGATGRSD